MPQKIKVLACGPVQGSFSILAKKLQSLQQSKAGPFDLCLCVGPFFASLTSSARSTTTIPSDGEQEKLLEEAKGLLSNQNQTVENDKYCMPLPLYFIDLGQIPPGIDLPPVVTPSQDIEEKNSMVVRDDQEIELDESLEDEYDDQDKKSVKQNFNGRKIAKNVFWLNGASADILSLPHVDRNGDEFFKSSSDKVDSASNIVHETLVVGYVKPHTSFTPIGTKLNSSNMQSLTAFEQKTRHPSFLGCDILLTSDYGQGLLSSTALLPNDKARLLTNLQTSNPQNTRQITLKELGSYDISEFAILSRPRYHFVSSSKTLQYQHFASLPFRNIAQGGSSIESIPREANNSLIRSMHVSRCVSLGSVLSPIESKKYGKSRKFLHALGISPLLTMNSVELSQEPSETVNNPYTDESYAKDSYNGALHESVNFNGKLSEAQARRILVEQDSKNLSQSLASAQQYRWNYSGKKRGYMQSNEDIQQQKQAAEDPNNKCLFIHGILKDPTIDGHLLLKTFQPYKSTKVRCPPHKNFGFVEFETHEDAKRCLEAFQGGKRDNQHGSGTFEDDDGNGSGLVLNGTYLRLKWSSGGVLAPASSSTLPPAPPEGQMLPSPPAQLRPSKRQRLTEAEAHDSVSLYFKLPPDVNSEHYSSCFEIIRLLMESSLEAAINADMNTDNENNNTQITAENEPALAVSLRFPNNPNSINDASSQASKSLLSFAFLVFASHAAASMAIASLTGHQDGGVILPETLQKFLAKNKFEILMSMIPKLTDRQDISLFWARGHTKKSNIEDNGMPRYPKDSRTDCWFCLASPTCENHLIVTIKENVYIAMPKGGLDNFHSLIIPIEHTYSDKDEKETVWKEINTVKKHLIDFARNELHKEMFVFEQALSTEKSQKYHTHIQCIPVEKALCQKLEGILLSTADKYNIQLRLLTDEKEDIWMGSIENEELQMLEKSGYFNVEIPTLTDNGTIAFKRYVSTVPSTSNTTNDGNLEPEGTKQNRPSIPLQFGREVIATAIGKRHFTQWKACVVDEAQETQLTLTFRDKLNQFESRLSKK